MLDSRTIRGDLAIIILLCSRAVVTAAEVGTFCDVRDHGAKGDGVTLDSPAINRTIERCGKAGGGVVALRAGRYVCGTLKLASGITLLLESGATLIGTTNLSEYAQFTPPAATPEAKFRPQWHRALILGVGVTNVAILGGGIVDGNKVFDPQGEERQRGPHTILLGNSEGIVIRDVLLRDSANYAVMLEGCGDVEIRGIKVTGGWDGVHFRGWSGQPCRNVTIANCQFYTGDDAIAGRYWENVVISDCIINSACNGIRLIGPAEQFIVRDCLFYGPGLYPHRSSNRSNMLAAVCLQPGAWDRTEGNLDQVLLSDLTIDKVTTPFHFSLREGNTAGTIRVNRVNATGVYRAACSVESWAATPWTNVVFQDVSVEFEGGGRPDPGRSEVKRPRVDARSLPAWAFYLRNVQKLTLDDVRVRTKNDDTRPVMIAEGVERLVMDDFRFSQAPTVTNQLVFTNVTQVFSNGVAIRE